MHNVKQKTKQNLKRKEIIWLIGTIVLILIFNFIFLGKDSLTLDSVIDINIHDTMFVIAKINLYILFSVLIFFSIYLIRVLRLNFKNKMANLIFLISNMLMILVLSNLISISDSYSQISGMTEASKNVKYSSNVFNIFSNILVINQILLLILMAYTGIKIGMINKK